MSAPRETVHASQCEKLRCFVDSVDSPLGHRSLGPLVGELKERLTRVAREKALGLVAAIAVTAVGGERAVTCAIC